MPVRITNRIPILRVADLARSARMYAGAFELVAEFLWGDGRMLSIQERDGVMAGNEPPVELDFGSIAHDEEAHPGWRECAPASRLFLATDQGAEGGSWVYLDAPDREMLDDLARRAHGLGFQILRGPEDFPWNMRELVLRDPDATTLRIGTPI